MKGPTRNLTLRGRWLAAVVLAGLTVAPAAAWARDKRDDDEADAGDGDGDGDAGADDGDGKRGFAVDDDDIDRTGTGDDEGDDDEGDDSAEPVPSEFTKDLFFVDKVDDRDTIDATLVQGSFTSSSFFYRESGGALAGAAGTGDTTSASRVARYFTDLRAQLVAHHIKGGNWDVRLDGRVRMAVDPDNLTVSPTKPFDVRAQSGAYGRNEYELREGALVRIGERSTFTLGRQLVTELAATRLDGARLDIAKSERLTVLGFAGLLPVRGARSIGFDYPRVQDEAGMSAGRLLPLGGGLGAAYRTAKAYGSFGAVVMVPGKGADPRAFLTSTGYVRQSPKLDAYHYAVIDVIGDAGVAVTNASLGVDYRPSPRLRASLSINHVDTETLDIVARNLLVDVEGTGVVRNDVEVRRVASNQGRVGVSASFGQVEQIELSTAISVRQRGEIPLTDGVTTLETLAAAKSVEVWGQAVHRDVKGARVGVDVAKIMGVGEATYGRSSVLSARVFASREFKGGKGEWDAGLSYASSTDDTIGTTCASVATCYGSSATSSLGLTGTVYYRLTPALFGIVMLDVNRASSTVTDMATSVQDPAVLGVSGFLRLAYRY